MTKTLFISHATRDDDHINRIYDLLTAAGLHAWVDHKEGIELGANWDSAIRKGIAGCDVGVFVMSTNSLASETCAAECLLVRELKKPLYVLRLTEVAPEHVWTYIKLIQYADLVSNFNTGVQRLIRTLDDRADPDDLIPLDVPVTGMTQVRQTLPYLFATPMRGRDEDVTALQTRLNNHAIQIVGTGGLGKSRLVAEIALKHPKGALWHRCSSSSRDTDVIELARQHFNLPDTANRAQILARLRDNPPLIVLDNAEDIPARSDQRTAYVTLITELNAHDAPLLLTSRVIWDDLRPRHDFTPRALTLEHAAQIALDFATSENLDMTPEQTHKLADSARLYPRLIEWAVGQLHERSLTSVLRHLDELTHENIKEALDEMLHKTVRQMVAQVKNGATAGALLRNLTVFRGSFTQEAAAALQPDVISDADALEDALVTLQKWRFVRREPKSERYRLDDIVREAIGEDDSLFPRYADFYITRAEKFDELQPEDWKQLDDDLIDITNVGDQLVTRTTTGTNGDLTRALTFAYNTTSYLEMRREVWRITWTEMGLNASRSLQSSVSDDNVYHRREALFLNEMARRYYNSEPLKAVGYFERSMALSQAIGDERAVAIRLNDLGTVWGDLGESIKALDYLEQALKLNRMREDRREEATTLNNIAKVYSYTGDSRKALIYIDEALRLFQSIGDKNREISVRVNIGALWNELGDPQKALDYLEPALSILQEFRDIEGEANALNNIGLAWSNLGETRKALKYYEQTLPLRRAVGDRGGEAATCYNIGREYEALGDLDKAIEYVRRCVELDEQIEHPDLASDRAYLEDLIRQRDGGTPQE